MIQILLTILTSLSIVFVPYIIGKVVDYYINITYFINPKKIVFDKWLIGFIVILILILVYGIIYTLYKFSGYLLNIYGFN